MNIYVSNLDVRTGDGELKTLFEQHGTVDSAKVIMDKFTGTSRGFAFVEMPNDGEGAKAIEQLNNQEVAGKKLSVSVARPKEDRQGSYAVGKNPFKKRF